MVKTYSINEMFYSLQGEGYHVGTPAVFIRFAGCNLACPFCDTQHRHGTRKTLDEIVDFAARHKARLVVLTGGEPALQVDAALVEELHAIGKYVAIETNGTHPVPSGIDWITLSPKDRFVEGANPVLNECDELKVVFDGVAPPPYADIRTSHRFLQPCDTGDEERDKLIIQKTVEYCKANPEWRLSLQTHKLIGIQ